MNKVSSPPLLLFSCSVASHSLRPHGLYHARLPCPSPSPRACSNSYPLNWWCHATISLLLSPSPLAFNLSQHQVFSKESALCIRWPKYWSFSFNPSNEHWIFMKLNGCCIFMNIENSFNSKGRFPLGLTGLISLLSRGLSGVFSSTKVQKHQFLGAFIFLNYDILERGSPFFPQMKSLPGDMRAWSLVLGDALSLALLVVITG